MSEPTLPRRQTLKQLAGLTALGLIGYLRAPRAAAANPATPVAAIPGVGGKIVRRGEKGYEIWRQSMVWHLSKPKRYPDVIVQARSTEDVIHAVQYAAANGLKVAVRSGGHNSNGPSLRDGGLLIDLSALEEIRIDSDQRIASIQPGVRSLGLVQAARDKGLTFPVPHCASVGLGGFTLGGGIGWNYPARGGVSTHSIIGAEIVMADGRLLRATAKENPDLYWAVRGVGPGFFGVVTRLDLKLYTAPKVILASTYILPLAEVKTATAALEKIRQAGKLGHTEPLLVFTHHPEAPDNAPPEQAKICFVTIFAFDESEEKARAALQPYAESALAGSKALFKAEFQPFDFEGLYDRYFSLNDPAGRCARYAVDNVLTNRGAETLHALADHYSKAPTRWCHVLAAFNMGTRVLPDSCFSWVADTFVGCYAIWDEEKDDAANFAWLGDNLPLMDPFADGHYVNEIEARGHPERYPACFSKANWNRLQALRRQYDPQGVFHSYLGHS
ncbi:MAG: FAD-binding oxidoreductase [Azonexus sp.]|jgi:FAD/FMN-containing dehydrogenase|nr:FAD-binding oxidoreductase [Azonexus sp.]